MYLPTLAWLISIPSLSNSPWMRGAPRAGWHGTSRGLVCEFRQLSVFARTSSANASRAKSLGGAAGPRWRASPAPSFRRNGATPGRAIPRSVDRPSITADGRDVDDSEPQPDGAVRLARVPIPGAANPAGQPTEHGRDECEPAGGTTRRQTKSLEVSHGFGVLERRGSQKRCAPARENRAAANTRWNQIVTTSCSLLFSLIA